MVRDDLEVAVDVRSNLLNILHKATQAGLDIGFHNLNADKLNNLSQAAYNLDSIVCNLKHELSLGEANERS